MLPTIRDIATDLGLNKYSFIVPWNKAPIIIAGIIVIIMCTTFGNTSRFGFIFIYSLNFGLYIIATANIDPSCIAISKVFANSPLKFNILPEIIKCPVEEIGKNSVMPCTMPSINVLYMSNIIFPS